MCRYVVLRGCTHHRSQRSSSTHWPGGHSALTLPGNWVKKNQTPPRPSIEKKIRIQEYPPFSSPEASVVENPNKAKSARTCRTTTETDVDIRCEDRRLPRSCFSTRPVSIRLSSYQPLGFGWLHCNPGVRRLAGHDMVTISTRANSVKNFTST